MVNNKRSIGKYLINLGVNPAHKGFEYLIESIHMVIEKPELKDHVTKELYPEVAKVFGSTASRVERAIRHAVTRAYDSPGGYERLASIMGPNSDVFHKGKVTNSTFIATIAWDFKTGG